MIARYKSHHASCEFREYFGGWQGFSKSGCFENSDHNEPSKTYFSIHPWGSLTWKAKKLMAKRRIFPQNSKGVVPGSSRHGFWPQSLDALHQIHWTKYSPWFQKPTEAMKKGPPSCLGYIRDYNTTQLFINGDYNNPINIDPYYPHPVFKIFTSWIFFLRFWTRDLFWGWWVEFPWPEIQSRLLKVTSKGK